MAAQALKNDGKNEKTQATEKRDSVLKTLSGKSGFQATKLAIETGERTEIDEEAQQNLSKRKQKELLTEETIEKRRRIRERGEVLQESLVDEGKAIRESLSSVSGTMSQIVGAIFPSAAPASHSTQTVDDKVKLEERISRLEETNNSILAILKQMQAGSGGSSNS